MEGKEWFEKSKYIYDLDEHDEGGYLGIDENKVAEMLDEYYQYKLKLLGLHIVRQHREQLLDFLTKHDRSMTERDITEYVDGYLKSNNCG